MCGGGDGITINTGNVRLALEGHTITAGVGAKRAIVASKQFGVLHNVRILGPGLITNGGGNAFREGVVFQFANNSEVSGVTVLRSGTGILAATCNFLTITANTLGQMGGGIELIDVHSSTISGNDAQRQQLLRYELNGECERGPRAGYGE